MAMNSDRYVTMLSQHLAALQATARLLADAAQPAPAAEAARARLVQELVSYAQAVRGRPWLLAAQPAGEVLPPPVAPAELHIRLLALETLVQLRLGRLAEPAAPPTDCAPASPEVLQRLVAAESRLFHLFQIVPLN